MYGKHFERMYQGSMRGAGSDVFAVWGYVISHVREDSLVELNPEIIAFLIGMPQERVEAAMGFLTATDPKSRNKEHDGRRLVRRGEFEYYVPSAAYYRGVRSTDDLREYNRVKQRESRARRNGSPTENKAAPWDLDDDKLSSSERITIDKSITRGQERLKQLELGKPYPSGDARIVEMKELREQLKEMKSKLGVPV